MSYFKTYFKFNKNLANQIFGEVFMKNNLVIQIFIVILQYNIKHGRNKISTFLCQAKSNGYSL